MKPCQWVVEFKIIKRFVVVASDEIEAENVAADNLSTRERDVATDVRIVDGRYEDGEEYKPRTDEWHLPMHRKRNVP